MLSNTRESRRPNALLAAPSLCCTSQSMFAFDDRQLPRYVKCSTLVNSCPFNVMLGGWDSLLASPGAGWNKTCVFFAIIVKPRAE